MQLETVIFKKGEVIFRENEEADTAYIIDAGQVEIYKRVERGTVLLAELGPGEIFGEMGIIEDKPRSAYASAASEVKLRKLSRQRLGELLRGQPQEVIIIVKALLERVRESSHKLSELINVQAAMQLGTEVDPMKIKRVAIFPLTEMLKKKMPPAGIVIQSLPFRVGSLPDNEEPNPLDWNNLFVKGAEAEGVSRNHFAIQRGESGVYVMDRGSKTGTIVNGAAIGGKSEKYKQDLKIGDNVIIAGDEKSPYRFQVVCE